MMFVLLVLLLLMIVTTGVMLFIAADLSAGIRQLQSVRVFNIAEAGIHYAIARLQGTGAATYNGETVPITDGITTATLGTAQVEVSCLDGTPPPCAGDDARFRRIVSVGTLPAAGPRRVVVAVVEGVPEGQSSYAICAYQDVIINQGINVYGDVGSNRNINLQGSASGYARVRNDPPAPFENPNNRYYSGSARAVGAINCSQGCPTQVAGQTSPYAPGPVCPTVPLPDFAPGTDNLTIASPTASYTMNAATGYSWQDIWVRAAGDSGGCTGSTPFRDLRIQTGAAGTTTVVHVLRLTMERCTRLVLVGDGNVDLRVSEYTGQAVLLGQYGRLGVLPTDTWDSPAPIPAGRLRVSVRSTSMDPAAVQVDRASIVAGAWHVPNGEFDLDRLAGQIGKFYGAVLTARADIDRDFIFTYDPAAALGTTTFGTFNRLKSWKDQ